jgi:hypothetical protein
MWIEPAVFGLLDFTADYLQKAEELSPHLRRRLGNSLGQSREVFDAMAAGQSVSYRLAKRTFDFLLEESPKAPPGVVLIRTGRRLVTCADENIDGWSDPDTSDPG